MDAINNTPIKPIPEPFEPGHKRHGGHCPRCSDRFIVTDDARRICRSCSLSLHGGVFFMLQEHHSHKPILKPAEADLTYRRPVWKVLSDLFLDTELQPSDLDDIVKTLDASPYSLHELDTILEHEVYPCCKSNLMCMAGEWAEIDPEWLEQQILTCKQRRFIWPFRLQMSWRILRHQWNPIRNQLLHK